MFVFHKAVFAFMKINDTEITFDVESWLSSRHIDRTKSASTEYFASCPFHVSRLGYESNAGAWSINTETGVHHCFSCGAGGSVATLVKHIDKFDTVWDAEQWLVDRYGIFTESTMTAPLQLPFDDPTPVYAGVPEMVLDEYRFRHPYLAGRGISDTWQTVFGIGWDAAHHAITIPWRFEDGTLATVKKRSVDRKQFWYDPKIPSGAKKRLLWGLSQVVGNIDRVRALAFTESETDAMYVWQTLWQRYGVAAVALGTNLPSAEQLALIHKYVPMTIPLVAMTDNNDAGRDAARSLTQGLSDSHVMSVIDWSLEPQYVDVNEMPAAALERLWLTKIDAVGMLMRHKLAN
jgi:DNA primase